MFWQENYSTHDLRQWGEKFNVIVMLKYSRAALQLFTLLACGSTQLVVTLPIAVSHEPSVQKF